MEQNPKNPKPEGPGGNGPKNRQSLLILLISTLVILVLWNVFSVFLSGSANQEITYDKFIEMVDNGEISKVVQESDKLTITPKEQKIQGIEFNYTVVMTEDGSALTKRLEGKDIVFEKKEPNMTASILSTICLLYTSPSPRDTR